MDGRNRQKGRPDGMNQNTGTGKSTDTTVLRSRSGEQSTRQTEENLGGSLDALGSVVRKYRRLAGLTQSGLAGELEVTRNTVIAWEAGRVRPQLEMLMRLSHLLRIPVTELFDVKVNSSGLTAPEQTLLDHYRQLNAEDRKAADRILCVLLEEEENARTEWLRTQYRPVATLATPAAAGPGCDYLDNTDAAIRFYRKNRRYDSADIVCRVCGHSMEPCYRDGDYVYARMAPTAEDGQDVICDSNDGRLIKRKAGNRLVSVNPDPVYQVHKSADDGVHIVAVVLGIVPDTDPAEQELIPELEELHADEIKALQQEQNRTD